MNGISAAIGIIGIPLSGMIWEFIAMVTIMPLFHWGTFNPVTWAASCVLAALLNTVVEVGSLRLIFKVRWTKRVSWWIGLKYGHRGNGTGEYHDQSAENMKMANQALDQSRDLVLENGCVDSSRPGQRGRSGSNGGAATRLYFSAASECSIVCWLAWSGCCGSVGEMMFRIEFTPEALADLQSFRRYDQAQIVAGIEGQLPQQADDPRVTANDCVPIV